MATPRDRRFTGFFALIASVSALGTLWLAVPKPVQPVQLPPLVLDGTAAEAAMAADRALSAKAPTGARVEELEQLFAEVGETELKPPPSLQGVPERERRLAMSAAELARDVGAAGLDALRAKTTERGMRALAAGDRSAEARGLLGSFPEIMLRYGLCDQLGRWRAPVLTIRATYKARWNLIHARPATEGFAPVELQAYWGWMALHAGSLPPERRAEAARAFYEAGGKRSAETYAIWLFQGGAIEPALSLMQQAFAQSGELRHRNMVLYMLAARAQP